MAEVRLISSQKHPSGADVLSPHSALSAKLYPTVMSERRYWNTPASSCFMGNTVDADILPFLKQLNTRHWMVSTSCCAGHSKGEGKIDEQPYIGIAVKIAYLNQFVKLLNKLTLHLENELDVLLDCELDYTTECATSCDFENFPDWVMFSLRFWGAEECVTDLEFWEKAAAGF